MALPNLESPHASTASFMCLTLNLQQNLPSSEIPLLFKSPPAKMPILRTVQIPPPRGLPSSFLLLCCQLQVHLQTCTNQLHETCVQALPPLLGCVHDLARWWMVTCVLIFIYSLQHLPSYCISPSGKERLKSEMNWDIL